MLSIYDKLYLNRFNEVERKMRKSLWNVLCTDFFQNFVSPKDTIVDMGAGFCEFINSIKAGRKIAIDKLTIAQFANKDVKILKNIEELEDSSVDVVFMSNFLEHLLSVEDVINTLNRLKQALKEKGKIIIMGPNMRFTYIHYWDFIDHRLQLSDKSLSELLRALDFKIIRVLPKFLPFTTKCKYPKWNWLVKIYLKTPILWKFFGKQYLILCENR